MPRVAPIELTDREREGLKTILKQGSAWRKRDRAETMLWLAAGHSVQAVAERQERCREAVRIRRRQWLKWGIASLPDRPWCGAPRNLTAEHRQ